MNVNDLITEMNHILQQWQCKYDILQLTHFAFTLGEDDITYLNEIPIHDFQPTPLSSATFDAEHILYYLGRSCILHVTVSWPEDGIPFVSSVSYASDR